MSVIESLVFDRTQADVDALEAFFRSVQEGTTDPLALDLTRAKGAYNVSDLNRVTEAMEYLHNRLEDNGYRSEFAPVTVPHRDGTEDGRWREDDEAITAGRLAAYLENVGAMRRALPTLPGTPQPPESMEELTITRANHIEEILFRMDQVLDALQTAPLRTGQVLLHCGGLAIHMKEAPPAFAMVYTADEKYLATADGLAVAVR